jgi:hypothetical protein
MNIVQQVRQKWFNFPAILLGAVLLRAFVPAGYMPAAPGQGLLFELCHDGLPVSFMSTLQGHAHHGDHSAHDDHGPIGECSFGDILTSAYIDAPDAPELPLVPADNTLPVVVADVRVTQRIYARAPRGPPAP